MRRTATVACIGLTVAVALVSCKKDEPPPTPPEPPKPSASAPVPAPDPAAAAVKAAKATLEQVDAAITAGDLDKAETLLKGLEDQKSTLPKEIQDEIDSHRRILDTAKQAKAIEAAGKAAEADLKKVLDAIKAGKLDEAETLLKALEAKKSTLPKPVQEQIAAARTSLDAARKAKAAQAADEEATGLLAKILAYITQGKLDLADTALKGLEAKKASFPQAIQDQIDGARKSLDAARAAKKVTDIKKDIKVPDANSIKLPAIPK